MRVKLFVAKFSVLVFWDDMISKIMIRSISPNNLFDIVPVYWQRENYPISLFSDSVIMLSWNIVLGSTCAIILRGRFASGRVNLVS